MLKTSRWLSLLFGASLLVASPVRAQVLYAASGSNGVAGNLYTIDSVTAAATLVGSIANAVGGGGIGITGLAFNPVDGFLYGITANGTAGGNTVVASLVRINPTTAVATVIGSGLGVTNSDISFRSDGTLFGYEAGGNTGGSRSMTTINLTTGAATKVGTTDLTLTFGGGLAFSSGGTLYLSASGAQGTLDTLDPATGARTPSVNTMTSAPIGGQGVMNAMAFNAAGTLFAVNSDKGTPASSFLVTINLSTLAVTQIGPPNANLPDNIDGLAFSQGKREIKTISKVGTTVTITIDSFTNYTYQLQHSTSPDSASFTNMGSPQNGTTGTTLTFTDSAASGTVGFYRISITP